MPPERNTPSGTSLINRSPNRLIEQRPKPLDILGPAPRLRAGNVAPEPEHPNRAGPHLAPLECQHVPGQQLLDAPNIVSAPASERVPSSSGIADLVRTRSNQSAFENRS